MKGACIYEKPKKISPCKMKAKSLGHVLSIILFAFWKYNLKQQKLSNKNWAWIFGSHKFAKHISSNSNSPRLQIEDNFICGSLYKWLIMPFNLSKALRTFLWVMNQAMQPFIGKFVIFYFNKIIIYSHSIELHLQNLQGISLIFRSYQFYAITYKFAFLVNQCNLLDFVISIVSITKELTKILTIQ